MAAGGSTKLVTPGHIVKCDEGDDVILSCQLSPKTSAVAMDIRWFVGSTCIYLSKDGHVMEGRGYEGRVSMDPLKLGRGDVSLTLRKSIEGDFGVYTCQVISGENKQEGRVSLLVMRASLQPALSYMIDELDERSEEITANERKKMEESVQSLLAEIQRRKIKHLEKTRELEESIEGINDRVCALEKRDGQQEESSKDHENRIRELEKNFREMTSRREHQIGQHFIDRHCIALIENVNMVDPVLDRLLKWRVLSREACDNVRCHRTRQKQMRSLLDQGSIHGTQKGKDLLYKALKETEPFLVQQLEQQLEQ